jgi:hypothetical protein
LLEMGSRRRTWSHGVDVRRRTTNGSGDRRAREVLMRRICIRYEDGRKVCFAPEPEEEFFSQDDAHRVVGMLHKGTEVLECAPHAIPWRPRWRGRTIAQDNRLQHMASCVVVRRSDKTETE